MQKTYFEGVEFVVIDKVDEYYIDALNKNNIQYKEILNHVSLKHELPKIYEKRTSIHRCFQERIYHYGKSSSDISEN